MNESAQGNATPLEPELVAVIAAAVQAVCGQRVQVTRIVPTAVTQSSLWSLAGRLAMHSSHTLNKR